MRTRLNIEHSPFKPTKVSFIFIGPNSLSRAEDLADVNHVTQADTFIEDRFITIPKTIYLLKDIKDVVFLTLELSAEIRK